MTGNQSTCHKCGKKKRERLEGSFTQWIFDRDSCNCDLELAGAGEKERPTCKSCGKPIATSRGGSMTQWIFRSDLCACQRADEGWKFDSDTSSSSEEVELQLEPSAFPVDRFKPLKELGSGASGTVYGCRDRLLGKRVAVKILRKLTAEQLVAFQNEARATSKLIHPAILQLLDFGPTESGIPYMVLEYFDSITLADYIKENGALEVPQFLQVFKPIITALEVAHSSGVFHRDLKPENILIGRTQRTDTGEPMVKLIDFGVAQLKQAAYSSVEIQGLTLAGTPGYMSPDIATGRPYDERSEIYSLGCVMFETLTGVNPFRAETAMESFALQSQIESPVLSDYSERSFPEELEEIILCCLDREPENRFESMSEIGSKLNAIAWEPDESQNILPEPEVKRRARFGVTLVAALAVGVGLVSLGVWAYLSIGISGPPTSKKSRTNSQASQQSDNLVKNSFDTFEVAVDHSLELFKPSEALLRAAAKGNSNKQWEVGRLYLRASDFSGAEEWLTKSANGGNVIAALQLVRMYESHQGEPSDAPKAFALCRKAAEAGHPEAQDALACMYYRGFGTPVNYEEAFRWMSEAGKQSHDRALTKVGVLYQQGRGVKMNIKKATSLFFETAERGCSLGQFCVGDAYEKGLGVDKSYERARHWFTVSTESPRPMEAAYMRLGRMNLLGLGAKKDPTLAFRQVVKAPFDISAEFYEGMIFALGEGVTRDYKQAAVSFEILSKHGEPDAELCLAYLYANGLGVERNEGKAKEYLARASKHSNGKFKPTTKLDRSFDLRKLMVEHDALSLDFLFDARVGPPVIVDSEPSFL